MFPYARRLWEAVLAFVQTLRQVAVFLAWIAFHLPGQTKMETTSIKIMMEAYATLMAALLLVVISHTIAVLVRARRVLRIRAVRRRSRQVHAVAQAAAVLLVVAVAAAVLLSRQAAAHSLRKIARK